jgi:hypothetical protein
MTREEERFVPMRSESLIHTVTKKKAMIQYGNPGVFSGGDVPVHADYAGHASTNCEMDFKARSLSIRCFSALAVRFGKSIEGSKPKWMFIGAKCFVGVEM